MVSKNKPATRLWGLLARDGPVGVVLRRGPSKQVLMIKWDTENEKFETDHWFKGRVYEERAGPLASQKTFNLFRG